MTPFQSCSASLVPLSINPPRLKMRGVKGRFWEGLVASSADSRRRLAEAVEARCLLARMEKRARQCVVLRE